MTDPVTWQELLDCAVRAKALVETWPAWKQEEARKAFSREFYDPASRWAEESKGIPPMAEPGWIDRLLKRIVTLRRELSASQIKVTRLEAENKRLRYRLKRLWLYDDVRTKVPHFDRLWEELRRGSVLVSPWSGARYYIQAMPDTGQWCLRGAVGYLWLTGRELREQGWHVASR